MVIFISLMLIFVPWIGYSVWHYNKQKESQPRAEEHRRGSEIDDLTGE